MSEAALAREMRFLINRMGLQSLVRLFRVFRHSDVVVSFIGENIERRGMREACVVSQAIRASDEINGK